MPSHSTAPPSTQVPSTLEGVPLNFPPDPPLPTDDALAASPGVHELPAVPRTLLIPLAARAMGAGCFPHLACGDALATRLLQTLGVDVSAYLEDRPTVLNILWRTRHICRAARSFFVHHPHAWGINLGAGLSHYFQWLDNSHNTWVDADLPEVMALRRSLIDEHSPRLRQAILVFANIPLALVGGVVALALSGEYLSVPASVGFIALMGIAVLNGLVLVTCFNQLSARGMPIQEVVRQGALRRLRPVLMTASITALGLIPLLLATGPGSEIQRPLAIVVIGGLVSSTLLTLVLLPILYRRFSAPQPQLAS